jgi:Inhibitor of apoptosis-promoting Bax1
LASSPLSEPLRASEVTGSAPGTSDSYAKAEPSALWQAAGATGAFVASLGAVGYATRRDLSSWYRVLFWALLGLLVFGLVAIFVSIPNENLIWSVAGLVIFGGYTILDFNRLRRAGEESAVPIAASIARPGTRPGSSRARRTDEGGRLRAVTKHWRDAHACHHRKANGRNRDPPVRG